MAVRFTEDYRPLYFLSALGAGGLSISFFMYLMFLVRHPGTPIPTSADLASVYRTGSTTTVVLVTVALAAIAVFAVRHLQLLVANLAALRSFRGGSGYRALRESNAEVTLMVVPLTLAMTVNVLFVLSALAVPGLWGVVEYLFPLALVAMTAIGGYAMLLFGGYLGRLLTRPGFDFDDANHFSQVLPSFAFAMVAVGFAAPAAMSTTTATSVAGMLGTFLFATAAVAWILIKLPISFAAMLRHGVAADAGPTLWMGIPILTLLGIAFVRVTAGISHTIVHGEPPATLLFVVLGLLLAAQAVMGLFGWSVMRRQGYFAEVVFGGVRSVPGYGLVCPGVALFVLSMFFIHWGMVRTGILVQYSTPHLAAIATVALIQVATIATFVRLNRKLIERPRIRAARGVPEPA